MYKPQAESTVDMKDTDDVYMMMMMISVFDYYQAILLSESAEKKEI